MSRRPKPIEHGTNSGYMQHHHRGDVTRWRSGQMERCVPCSEAHTRHNVAERKERKDKPPRPPRVPGQPYASYVSTTQGLVPHEVLGALLLHVPDEIEQWARSRMSDYAVDRALWWAGSADYPARWSAA